MAKLTLYTKSNCHLCDDMKNLIYKLKDEINFEYEEIDIEKNIELYEKFKEKIPVLSANGKIFAKYRIDEDKLRRKILS